MIHVDDQLLWKIIKLANYADIFFVTILGNVASIRGAILEEYLQSFEKTRFANIVSAEDGRECAKSDRAFLLEATESLYS